MLRLTAEQYDWVLQTQHQRLAAALCAAVARQWPVLAQKLGDRGDAFVDAALLQAHRHGLVEPTHAARYANLWCVWGPAFDDKAGFEWATEILADERRPASVKVQQLALRTHDEIMRRAPPGLTAAQFDAADAAMEAMAGEPASAPWIDGPSGRVQPRNVCDLSAFDIALGDQGWRQEYRMAWTAQGPLVSRAVPAVPPQRFRSDTPSAPGAAAGPRQIAALAYIAAKGHKAWLHLRCAADTVCNDKVHPRVDLTSDMGRQTFEGQAARMIKLPLHAAEVFVPPKAPGQGGAGPVSAAALPPGAPVSVLTTDGGLCRERPPRLIRIDAGTCGLRRAGAPLGPQQAMLSVYPAEQWLADFKCPPQPTWHWPDSGARAPAPLAQVRLERDGDVLPGGADWARGWAQLPEAFIQGVEGWLTELTRHEAVTHPHLEITPELMHGSAAWTWGAREDVTAEGSTGFLRAQGIARLLACGTDATLSAELRRGGAHARLSLRSTGRAELKIDVLREQPEPALPALLSAAKAQWKHPFVVELEALSTPELAVMSLAHGSLAGALSGEAGLKPRPDGQGWQWYLQLRLEPATLNLLVWDPVRGTQQIKQPLWPALTLVDWSVG